MPHGSGDDVERVEVPGTADMAELARTACGRYGLPGACTLHLYPLTENWTYRVESGAGGPTVLRIYRPGGRSPAEIMSELAWMGAIRDEAGSLVPAVIPTAGGSPALELAREAPTDPCYCVMFTCMPGREPAEDELAAWFPRLGAITAWLHRHARSWARPEWFCRPRWDVRTTLGDRPHWGPWWSSVTELIALWVDGYRQVEPLPAEDEAEIDTFLMLRRLMLTAYAGLRHDTELAAQMGASGYNAETCALAEAGSADVRYWRPTGL